MLKNNRTMTKGRLNSLRKYGKIKAVETTILYSEVALDDHTSHESHSDLNEPQSIRDYPL